MDTGLPDSDQTWLDRAGPVASPASSTVPAEPAGPVTPGLP